jgi:hypothetical protein
LPDSKFGTKRAFSVGSYSFRFAERIHAKAVRGYTTVAQIHKRTTLTEEKEKKKAKPFFALYEGVMKENRPSGKEEKRNMTARMWIQANR